MITTTAQRVLRIQDGDDLIVALSDLHAGETIDFAGRTYTLSQRVPAKHKFAARDLPAGARVKMYGVTVGVTAAPIAAGQLITTANLTHATDPAAWRGGCPGAPGWRPPDVSAWRRRTFDGYHRSDGRVGAANHWIVVPLVFCENRNIAAVRDALVEELGYAKLSGYRRFSRTLAQAVRSGAAPQQILEASLEFDPAAPPAERLFPNVDGVKFLTHTIGCGGTWQDAADLCGLLAGYIHHPNVAGATVLSLGCQKATVKILMDELRRRSPDPRFDKPLFVIEQQKLGTEQATIAEAIRRTLTGLMHANECRRRPAPLRHITLGVECGGSDGFSGLSANPAIGHCADLLVALGGTVILSEFPELAGVEQELVDRCAEQPIAERFLSIMKTYNDLSHAVVGSGFEANPSPGNIADGLITDAMKSAGAVRKGGTSPVVDVLDYPHIAVKPGLNLLCTPGGDVESTTAMAGSGATVMAFSTGMGTPTGNPVSPTLKISTNSATARRMPDIIDLDAGPIIEGAAAIEQIGRQLLDMVIDTAAGRYTPKAVALGQDDFIPWKRGVSL